MRDNPWMMRTYAGHSSAKESNALYRMNLAKGQTGLSVAFDLPTQTGYDPDHILARGEVGKVGVPISHLGDMRALFDGIPLGEMNTSMTINATAMWLLALYATVAEEQGASLSSLTGTTQNDIIKEYLSRGTYIFPPGPSLRLITDMVTWTVNNVPSWNPINICSYHLQEAGATPVQELAYAMCTAIAVLDAVRDSGQVPPERFGEVVARMSFFVNAGVRFVEEMCKMRAFVEVWDKLTQERYGIDDERQRRFRYGVQVNSLGLTEAQPENNVQRIVLEMLAVTLSKDARARAGVTTGEWAQVLRHVFGEFRAPTGVSGVSGVAPVTNELARVREHVAQTGAELGARLRMLVGKPGLDGHSNGAEQIAVRARDAGFEVVYQGIRLTPDQIVAAAVSEDVDVVGLSILSGSHLELVPMVLAGLRSADMGDIPVVVGGIIPDADAVTLKEAGVAAVFTPKDYDATVIMAKVLDEIRVTRGLTRLTAD